MIATALAGGAVVAAPAGAWAQSAAEQQKSSSYNIPAQDLSGALRQFAEASGLQLIYDAKVAAGKQSGGVSGTMTAQAALSRVLAGSGLGYSFSGSAVTISAGDGGAVASGAKVLAPVRVQSDYAEGSPVNGVNGSRDVTATEGTNSYTSGALDIVSKIPQSIKDTPQSVSVVTAQQIADENLNDISTALAQAPGITVINSSGVGSAQQTNFYSRGFQITTLQIDGGAPLDMQSAYGFSPLLDMSEYDSLQIIRGADGLFGGYGDPSGVVDLVRKKPLDHDQFTSDTQIGSWNNYRETFDVTGPLTADKNLKGRLVVSYQDNDYFYKIAHNNQYHVYGNLEYDFSPNTTVNVGASYGQVRQIPNSSGIPTYPTGGAYPLPQSTCLCFAWSRDDTINTEAFVQVNHKFNSDWGVKLDFTYNNQSQYYDAGSVAPGYPATHYQASAYLFKFANQQYIGDFTLNGGFDFLGHKQYIVIGGSYSYEDGPNDQYNPLTFAPLTMPNENPSVNIFSFNPNAPQYARAGGVSLAVESPNNTQTEYTLYANTKITLLDPLHLIVGLRLNGYGYTYSSNTICQPLYVVFGLCSTAGAPIPSFALNEKYGDNHFSAPPDVSLVYDVTKTLSAYVSYTDIYISNANALQGTGAPQVPYAPFTGFGAPIAPTTGYNEEVGLKWQRSDKKLNATLAFYNIRQFNFPDYFGSGKLPRFGLLPDGADCCFAAGGLTKTSQGIDLELAGEIAKGWNFSGSYNYNVTEQEESGANSPGLQIYSQSPRNLLKIFTTYKFQSDGWLGRVSVGGGLNYQSKTDEVAYQYYNAQKDYALLNLRAEYEINKHWDASVNVTNATNVKYFNTLGLNGGGQFYGQPAAFTFDLKAKW